MQWETCSERETEAAGARLAARLHPGSVVALYGGLGMGKTAFVRGMAEGMGISAEVSSPTFALVHEYGGTPPLVHFEMYRVNGWEDLDSTGFFDYIGRGAGLAVGGSENNEAGRHTDAIRVRDEAMMEGKRRITVTGVEEDRCG